MHYTKCLIFFFLQTPFNRLQLLVLVPERRSHGQARGVGQATSGVSYGALPPGSLFPLHWGLQPPTAPAKSLPSLRR